MSTSSAMKPPPVEIQVKFTREDAEQAYDTWHANCGPGALAAVLNLTLDEVRPFLVGFDQKHYTNPTMMGQAIKAAGVHFFGMKAAKQANCVIEHATQWPRHGLVRVQWEGPWTKPGVPIHVRYRHTHWVASYRDEQEAFVFDINCMAVGGWVPWREWADDVVPWLLRETEPKADGRWHATHRWEVWKG